MASRLNSSFISLKIFVVMGIALVPSFLVGTHSAFAAEVVERIVAVVNDELVTERDLELAMAPVVEHFRTLYTGNQFDENLKKARQDILNKVIEDKLILSEAKRKKITAQDAEIDEMIQEVRNKFPSHEIFVKAMEAQGVTEAELRKRFHDQLMVQHLVDYEVQSRVAVSPGEVSVYYKEHEKEFTGKPQVRLQQILIRSSNGRTLEEAKASAESLVEQLKKGSSFDELARSHSEAAEAKEGGQMGWVDKGQLLGRIDEEIFALGVGEITQPIESSLGYHIFKVMEKKDVETKPFSEVKDDIQSAIFRKKMTQRLQAWIAQLRANAYLSVHP